jgi:hypothetical protein
VGTACTVDWGSAVDRDGVLQNLADRLIRQEDGDPIPLVKEYVQGTLRSDGELPPGHWHPLGFLTAELGRSAGGDKLSLHIWPPSDRRTQDPAWLVHRHVWHLASCIVTGRVFNLYYDVQPVSSASVATNRLYFQTSVGKVSSIIRTSQLVSCTQSQRAEHCSGAVYEVPMNKYHTTLSPEDEFAATVVATSPRRRDQADVVGDIAGLPRYDYRRERVEQSQMRSLLDDLLRAA